VDESLVLLQLHMDPSFFLVFVPSKCSAHCYETQPSSQIQEGRNVEAALCGTVNL
jgi:hypothetical protein